VSARFFFCSLSGGLDRFAALRRERLLAQEKTAESDWLSAVSVNYVVRI
jgi:hypothetical protein